MKISLEIPKSQQFRPFYIFFVIVSMQAGVGIIGGPRIVFLESGHDAWISIIIAYFVILLLLFIMLSILRQYENTDILGVQADLFGSFISKSIGIVYVFYFALQILATLVTYIEIIKVFILPDSDSFVIGLMLLILSVYAVFGGLRTIIGVSFLFIILSFWVLFLLYEPIQQMDFLNFLPIMDKEVTDILRGTYASAYTFTGFEILFFIYPFVTNKKKIGKPLYLGFTYISFVVLALTVVSIGFLSSEQLERRIWPTLNLFKIQSTPIIERLDYIIVAEWMMVTVPRVILLIWGIAYILKRIYRIPKNISVYTTAGILLVLIPFFTDHFVIQTLIDNTGYLALGITYIYPLILLPLVMIKKKSRKKKGGKSHEGS